MNVEHFKSNHSFSDLVKQIKEFVEPRGNKIKFVNIEYRNLTDGYHAVLIYNEVSDRVGGLT